MNGPRRTICGVPPLILASASPRRADLLRAAAIPFEVHPADVDEQRLPDEPPYRYVRRLAEAKAIAIAARFPGRAVLGADTVVVLGGEVLGKPADPADATRMLRRLSGRTHEVLTGLCLVGQDGATAGSGRRTDTTVTTVTFAVLGEAEIEWYVASGEPLDKAGAYAIQGLASRFVTTIDGSYSNVVGLPVARLYEMCTAAGMLVS
jgi:septum formation protein